ncbi:MAG: hypothetical protein AAGF11_25685 [Myxococcota bacterium]
MDAGRLRRGRASYARACVLMAMGLVGCGEPSIDVVVLWVDGVSDDTGKRRVRIYEAGERDTLRLRPDIPGSSIDLLQVGIDDRARGFAVSGTDATVWIERGSGRRVTLDAAAVGLSAVSGPNVSLAAGFSFTSNGDGLLRGAAIQGSDVPTWLFAPLSGPQALKVEIVSPPFPGDWSLRHAADAPVMIWAQLPARSSPVVAGEIWAVAYPSTVGQGPRVDQMRPLGRGMIEGPQLALDARYLPGCPQRLCVAPSGRAVFTMASQQPSRNCDLLRWSWVDAPSTGVLTDAERLPLACPADEPTMLAAVLDDDLVVLDDQRRLYLVDLNLVDLNLVDLNLVDLAAGAISAIPKPVDTLSPYLAARGRVLLVTSSQGEVVRVDAQGPRMVSGIQTPCEVTGETVISPSGTWVVQTCNTQGGVTGLSGQVRRVSVLGVELLSGIPMRPVAVDDEGNALLYSVSADDDDDDDLVPRGLFVLTGDGQLTRVDELEPFPGQVMLPGTDAQQSPGRFSVAGPS